MVRKEQRTTRIVRPAAPPWRSWLRRVPWRSVTVFLVVVATAVGLAYGATLEPFRVTSESVTVTGNHRLEAWEVADAADVAGRNVFMLDAKDVAARVSKLAGVNDVLVRVHLPNRVIVELVEFMPLVAWQTPQATRWLSEDGALIPISGDAPNLTLIDPAGGAADKKGNLRTKVLENLNALARIRPDVREVFYGALEGLYFRAPEGWTVYLGEEGQMERKLGILAGMQQNRAEGECPNHILDLRFEEFATCR
jgi:cell division septal protein FtsQ